MSEASPDSGPLGIARRESGTDRALAQVRDALRGLSYGVISIIVQDGVVVQIERTEKHRLRRSESR